MRASKLYISFFTGYILFSILLCGAVSVEAAERCVYKFDNVLLIFDRSGSMLEPQSGSNVSKFVYAGEIAEKIATDIPRADEGELHMGLKVFGFHYEDEPLKIRTVVARKKLDSEALARSVRGFRPPKDLFGFVTPLARSLHSIREEATQWPGRTAVILISDGQDTTFFAKPVEEARLLKQEKPDVVIYAIWMSGCKQGRKTMEQIASTTGGKFIEAVTFHDPARRKAELREIFLECTPVPVAEIPVAPPPPPMRKPERPPVTDEMFPVILFDFDRVNIPDSEKPKLEKAANILTSNPDVRIRLEGHTDSIGTEEYNQALSERRARSVMDYIHKTFGIARERMEAIGFGESKPVAPDDTAENRQKNRRVEFKVKK